MNGPYDIELVERELVCGEDDVIVKNHLIGICGSDKSFYRGKLPLKTAEFRQEPSFPFMLGHESGGTVVVRSYETPTHFCVEVKDDGVGFDPSLPIDEKKHVGLRNIRGRLKAMVDGDLILESKPGVGTKAVIRIPKEVTV